MTINYILDNIFSENDIKWHCKDINGIAMAEFNVACPFGMPFSEPIIDVKEVSVRGECIVSSSNRYKEKWVKVVCLINSNDPNDRDKILTVRQVLEKLKYFDGELELCSADKGHDFESNNWVCAFINVFDGTDNDECEKHNIPENYKGTITNFLT